MKVNLDVKLKNFDRSEVLEDKEVEKDGKKTKEKFPVLIRTLVAKALFNGQGIEKTGRTDVDNDNRFKSYLLYQKIISSDGEIDLSPEELVMIKQAVSIYTDNGVYGQIVELVDPK